MAVILDCSRESHGELNRRIAVGVRPHIPHADVIAKDRLLAGRWHRLILSLNHCRSRAAPNADAATSAVLVSRISRRLGLFSPKACELLTASLDRCAIAQHGALRDLSAC
jgi:hypothetical protein